MYQWRRPVRINRHERRLRLNRGDVFFFVPQARSKDFKSGAHVTVCKLYLQLYIVGFEY